MAGALLTDLYELNMAASYLRRGMNGAATFSLFVRKLPPGRRFLVAAGVDSCLEWLEGFSFEDHDLEYARRLGFDRETLEAFSRLRFSGEVWAVPEGRVVFPGEPILEVTAPIAQAQLAETYLLNQVSFQCALASKAARCRIAARGKVRLVEFGFRRTHGVEAGIAAARVSALVGFDSTSNVEAARRFGLVPAGPMAHYYVEAFTEEVDAFRAFAEDLPSATTFLVDTYDTAAGVAHAIEVIKERGIESRSGVRIDSGDLEHLAYMAREMLDEAGLGEVKIFLSGNLDEHDIDRLVSAGTPFDAAGIGTRLGVSADAPYVDSAYKLVDYEGRAVMKLSTGKVTLPGPKQVFRFPGMRDVLGLRDDVLPPGAEPLLERVMAEGRRLRPAVSLEESRTLFDSELSSMPEALKSLEAVEEPEIELTPRLAELTSLTRADARAKGAAPP